MLFLRPFSGKPDFDFLIVPELPQPQRPLVRAMVLKAEVMGNPLANTTGHQGYIEPEKEVMQQVVTFLTGKVSAFSVTP